MRTLPMPVDVEEDIGSTVGTFPFNLELGDCQVFVVLRGTVLGSSGIGSVEVVEINKPALVRIRFYPERFHSRSECRLESAPLLRG